MYFRNLIRLNLLPTFSLILFSGRASAIIRSTTCCQRGRRRPRRATLDLESSSTCLFASEDTGSIQNWECYYMLTSWSQWTTVIGYRKNLNQRELSKLAQLTFTTLACFIEQLLRLKSRRTHAALFTRQTCH